jgi:hypothetical protein
MTPTPTLNAGTINVGDATSSTQLLYQSSDSYAADSTQIVLWAGGTTITASGGGPDVTSFSLSKAVPLVGVLTAPTFVPPTSGFQPLSIGAPITVTWTATSADTVQVYLGAESSTTYSSVVCEVSASSGQVQIASAAMAGMSGYSGIFDVTALGRTSTVQGTTEIEFSTSSFMQGPGGMASYPVMLQ